MSLRLVQANVVDLGAYRAEKLAAISGRGTMPVSPGGYYANSAVPVSTPLVLAGPGGEAA